jgi:predicted Mrr-cat superfamily restriction endonuclease
MMALLSFYSHTKVVSWKIRVLDEDFSNASKVSLILTLTTNNTCQATPDKAMKRLKGYDYCYCQA